MRFDDPALEHCIRFGYLPSPLIETQWVPASLIPDVDYEAVHAEFRATCNRPGWNPKFTKLSDGRTAVDCCADWDSGDLHSIKVAVIEDHPFLAMLPIGTPNAVKTVYKRDVRVKYLMATSGLDFFHDFDRAKSAWLRFVGASE